MGGSVVQNHAYGGAHEAEREDKEDGARSRKAGGGNGDGQEVVVGEDSVGDGVTCLRGQRASADKLQTYPVEKSTICTQT